MKMNIFYMIRLNAVICGIEFCSSAAFCFLPPMLLKSGISEQGMSFVLGAGPFLGLFAVPIIGQWSDNCENRYGRRKPFIVALSLLMLFSLLILLLSKYIGLYILHDSSFGEKVMLTMLIFGSILLDFTCQTCLTPCEALLSDLSTNSDEHHQLFSMYSFMISLGGCVGYLLTALDFSSLNSDEYIFKSESYIFMLLFIFYLMSFLITINAAKEIPLSTNHSINKTSNLTFENYNLKKVNVLSTFNSKEHKDFGSDFYLSKSLSYCQSCFSACFCNVRYYLFALLVPLFQTISNVIFGFINMPKVLKRLALANFFSWIAIMTFTIYYTDFVGQIIFFGNPNAKENSDLRNQYDEGVRNGSLGLFFHCICSALYAPFIKYISFYIGLRLTYLLGMVTFVLSTLIMSLSVQNGIMIINICATCTGFAFATLTTIPFMLLEFYHFHSEVYFSDTHDGLKIPLRGIATDLSLLDSAYFLSQVLLTVFIGSIVEYTNCILAYIIFSCIFGFISCISILYIIY